MKPPLMAIDLGGTIEDSWQSKRLWFQARGFDLGPWPLSRSEVIEIIKDQAALYEQMAAEVYMDTNILSHEPVEGVVAALHTLAQDFRIAVLSSRTETHRPTTCTWLRRCGLIRSVAEIALLGADGNKLAWCQNAGATTLVDDDVRHLEPTDDRRTITRIHFCARPCSPPPPQHNILVATTWPGILNILRKSATLRADHRVQVAEPGKTNLI